MKKKKEKSIYSKIISYLFSLLIFVICIFISVKVIVANKEGVPPSIFGYSISEVPTASMEPTIKTGDYVIFYKISYDEVEVGDIIVYKSKASDTNGMFIIHRVIEIKEGYLVTKGDNNALADSEEITSDMVYGKYCFTVSFLNFLGTSSSRQSIFFLLMAILFIVVIMQLVLVAIKATKHAHEEKIKNEVIEEMKKEILKEELRKEMLNQIKDDNKE